jgi:hypothetical protein
MTKLGRKIGTTATKATVRHSAHGLASKARRKPLRSITLLSIGAAVGVSTGWFVARKTA